jgi:hypothetical protein
MKDYFEIIAFMSRKDGSEPRVIVGLPFILNVGGKAVRLLGCVQRRVSY